MIRVTWSTLGVQPGEVVELAGKRATAVTAWPADDEEGETDIISIDGQTRKNAGVGLNDLLERPKDREQGRPRA